MEIDARMVVTKDKEMDQKGSELREGGLTDQIANQMTVTMTDKDPAWSTLCKGENKEASLSELGSSPTGSFQSLQSSQSSEGCSDTFMNLPVGETRVLKFEDTLSKEDCRNFKLIYEFLLLEGRAGNLTNLSLEMVLAEKTPTWLSVMLKHLIINADAFKEKMRMGLYPQIGEKGKKNNQNRGKQPRGVKVVKNKRCNSGKGSKNTRTHRNNLKAGSTIGNLINQKDFGLVCWI